MSDETLLAKARRVNNAGYGWQGAGVWGDRFQVMLIGRDGQAVVGFLGRSLDDATDAALAWIERTNKAKEEPTDAETGS